MTDSIIKIFGLVLLIVGVILIAWTLYSSYNIFTGKTEIPGVFKSEAKETQTPPATSGKTPTSQAELQKELEKTIGEQLKGLIPSDLITKILNLTVWSLLAFILIFGASQISHLGIKLIKK